MDRQGSLTGDETTFFLFIWTFKWRCNNGLSQKKLTAVSYLHLML